MRLRFSAALCASLLAALAVVSAQGQSQQRPERPNDGQESFRFKSGVELINVTATVTDANGRFVPGLRQDDFVTVTINGEDLDRTPHDNIGAVAGFAFPEDQRRSGKLDDLGDLSKRVEFGGIKIAEQSQALEELFAFRGNHDSLRVAAEEWVQASSLR